MQVETSTNIKQSWLIKVTLSNNNHINLWFFSIFRTPYSSHTSQLLEIRLKLSIFHFHLVFAIRGHFFVTGFSNRRTCQLFFQAFHTKHFKFSGTNATGNTKILMYFYLYIYEKTLICAAFHRDKDCCVLGAA